MNHTKSSFIKLALECQALKFGTFTLKSGRTSPYFFNAGQFYTGSSLAQLGDYYAATLVDNKVEFDHLFGPAYKGLPLATATAIALHHYSKETTVTFNRKEVKDHGEGGQLIGAPLSGRTIIIDDVITAGTAFRESQTLIQANGGALSGVIIALNRCEQGIGTKSTLEEISDQGIAVYSIITFFDLVDYLKDQQQEEQVQRMQAYYERYGR